MALLPSTLARIERNRQQALARRAQLAWRRSAAPGAALWRRRNVLMRRVVPSLAKRWRSNARRFVDMRGRSIAQARMQSGRRLVNVRTGRVLPRNLRLTIHSTPPNYNSYFPALYDVSAFRR